MWIAVLPLALESQQLQICWTARLRGWDKGMEGKKGMSFLDSLLRVISLREKEAEEGCPWGPLPPKRPQVGLTPAK